MQKKAFQPLLDKYNDNETIPVNESLEQFSEKILYISFFKIKTDNKVVDAIRIVQRHNCNWISLIFILPEFQEKGLPKKI